MRAFLGTKAANLHRLAEAGFAVPAGFVLPDGLDLARLADRELLDAVERIGGWPVAVRSSGRLEDLEGASFAGQYRSHLGVGSVAELREKIGDCRASGGSDQLAAYLKSRGLSGRRASVSVLVQKMVDARAAGVAFSIHPLTGREEHGLVECCAGLGDALVSGRIEPTRYVLRLVDGAVVEREAGAGDVRLDEPELVALAKLCLDTMALFGVPQDVEWAIDRGGKLWVLQSRPVTRVQWRSDVEELTNADLKDGGVSARVCTPMMFSLYRNAMQGSMQEYFEEIRLLPANSAPETWIGSYYGRVYWNAAAVKRALFKIPGFDEEKFDQDLGIQKSYPASGPVRVPFTTATVARALPVALALESHYRRQLAATERFEEEFAPERRDCHARIERFADTPDNAFFENLLEIFDRLHPWVETTYLKTIYNNANAQTDFKSFVAKLDRASGGVTSVVKLLGGLTDVSHMEMQKDLVALYRIADTHGFDAPEWEPALRAFIERHGFHSDAELDLSVPRWVEAPERVRRIVEGMQAAGAAPSDPVETAASQKRLYEDELARVERRIRSNLWLRLRFASGLRRQLRRVRTYLSRRERMREFSTQCYLIVRLYVLEAGRRLAANGRLERADDALMLHTRELLEAAGGRLTRARELVAFRRAMYEGYRAFQAPNEFGRGVTQRNEATYVEAVDGRTVLRGLGCSAGTVEGVVRVVASLEDIHVIQGGDILVTRFTDPGWTPVLGLVSGVVTEVGGLLSHAAVIGREYGIPAVLNLPGATRALVTGQRVRLDGTSGTVEVLS